MSVERALEQRAYEPSRVALIFALRMEGECLAPHVGRSSGALLSLHQCGPGAARARRAAAAAVAAGAAGLVSVGLAGGLLPGLAPGSIVLPRTIVRTDGAAFATDAGWRDRLRDALCARFAVSDGPLLAAADVLDRPSVKARAAAETCAVAVDLESAAVAEIAAVAGVPFVAIRVIVDGAEDTLPPGVERWIDERGDRRLAPAVGAALNPGQWRCLLTLARRSRVARRTLDAMSRELVPQGFLLEHGAPARERARP